jgi:hypothetical protein
VERGAQLLDRSHGLHTLVVRGILAVGVDEPAATAAATAGAESFCLMSNISSQKLAAQVYVRVQYASIHVLLSPHLLSCLSAVLLICCPAAC